MTNKRNCQSCEYYKDEYCENLELKPCYPQKGCDDFSKRNELKKDTIQVLEAYISPNGIGFPDVKDAIKDLLEWSKNEYKRGWSDALSKALDEAYTIHFEEDIFQVVQAETLIGLMYVRMTKAELMCYVGKKVHIYFENGEKDIYGTLGYADEFSAKYDYRKPNYFYIGNTSFKASHVRKLVESEDKE